MGISLLWIVIDQGTFKKVELWISTCELSYKSTAKGKKLSKSFKKIMFQIRLTS